MPGARGARRGLHISDQRDRRPPPGVVRPRTCRSAFPPALMLGRCPDDAPARERALATCPPVFSHSLAAGDFGGCREACRDLARVARHGFGLAKNLPTASHGVGVSAPRHDTTCPGVPPFSRSWAGRSSPAPPWDVSLRSPSTAVRNRHDGARIGSHLRETTYTCTCTHTPTYTYM